MRTIKLLVLTLFLSVCSYGQSIDNVLNSTLLGLNKQQTFTEMSNRLDSTWKYNYTDSDYGEMLYVWSNLDSIDNYYIKYTWVFDEYDLAYAFSSIEYYGDRTDNVFENIKEKFNKYGHLTNSKKRGNKVTYSYYVNNYHPLIISIEMVDMEVKGKNFEAISYSVLCEKPKNLEIYYYIYEMLKSKDSKIKKSIKQI